MNFGLRRPCPRCPFRLDRPPYLRGARAQEIATSLARGADFACHETTVDDEDDEATRVATSKSQFCAGALIVMEREGSNQIMRIAEQLGRYDPSRLDVTAPVARSLVEFVEHHAGEEEEADPCSVCDAGCLAPAGYLEGGAVIPNVEVDPEVMLECPGCGEPVCTECATDAGYCPDCEEC